jgi:hypothetical protein
MQRDSTTHRKARPVWPNVGLSNAGKVVQEMAGIRSLC